MKKIKQDGFRLIVNDDCDGHLKFGPELFDMWAKTAVNTFSLCIAGDVLNYNAKVGQTLKECVRRAYEENRLPEYWRNWYDFFVRDGKDPLAMAIEGCRKNGIEIFASIRMNDIHHGANPDDPLLSLLVSTFWREHPEYRAKGWDRRGWASYSFEFPEVRERRLDIIRDVASRYDVDGFDLDFSRMPPFFDRGREYECRHHMTGLIRAARKILDEEGKKRGKRIKLSAACLASIKRSEEVGLDVKIWVNEGLVDILIPCWLKQDGTDYPLDEFLKLACARDTEICPSYGSGVCVRTAEAVRAMALSCYKGGANGLQLFNFFAPEELSTPERILYDQGIFSEIGRPELLEQKDKHYYFQYGLPIAVTVGELPPHDYYYWLDVRLGQRLPVPVPGRKDTGEAEYNFNIADDIEKARALNILREQKLSFNMIFTNPWEKNIEIYLNKERISDEALSQKFMASEPQGASRSMPPYTQYDIDLGKVKRVRNGQNTLGVKVLSFDKTKVTSDMYRGLDLLLFEVELFLKYRERSKAGDFPGKL